MDGQAYIWIYNSLSMDVALCVHVMKKSDLLLLLLFPKDSYHLLQDNIWHPDMALHWVLHMKNI